MRGAGALSIALGLLSVTADGAAISITDFLGTVKKDYNLESEIAKIEFLREAPSNLPFLDEVELRIRNEAFRFDRQRYGLRVSPAGWGETRAARNVQRALLAHSEERKALRLNRLLKQHYNLVVELLYRRAMQGLDAKLKVLYEDRIRVLKERVNELDFDFNDLVKAEEDYTELELKIIDRGHKIAVHEDKIREYMPDLAAAEFDTSGMVSVDEIATVLDTTRFELDTANVNLRESGLRFDLARSRYELEAAQSRKVIDFFEFSYDQGDYVRFEPDPEDRNRWFLMSMAIPLPIVNTDRVAVNRRKVAALDDKGDYEDLREGLVDRIRTLSGDMTMLIAQYRLLRKREQEMNTESSLKTYLQVEGIDPLVLLRTKESAIKSEIEREKITFEIYLNYIALLDITGRLSREPLRNVLSKAREPIGQ